MAVSCSDSPMPPDPDVEAAVADAVDDDTAAVATPEAVQFDANAPPTDNLSKGAPYRPHQEEKR